MKSQGISNFSIHTAKIVISSAVDIHKLHKSSQQSRNYILVQIEVITNQVHE